MQQSIIVLKFGLVMDDLDLLGVEIIVKPGIAVHLEGSNPCFVYTAMKMRKTTPPS